MGTEHLEPTVELDPDSGTDRGAAAAASATDRPTPRDRDVAPLPARVGRYVVCGRLGEGGMGVVLEVFDPELDRTVALKLLRSGHADRNAVPRMLREARALAALTHPNVVPVYEAGTTDDGEVFIAMELVRGQTLRQWLDGESRPWTEVLPVFRQAALGLQAAHAAGIVHRDFKPANVILGEDGRVRVMDFGLAQPSGLGTTSAELGASPSAGDSFEHGTRSGTDSARLTRTGFIMGTPAYMAPEQDHGHPLDARADQYSLCVALYEALYGVRPFVGRDRRALAKARATMQLQAPARGHRVPRWIGDAVRRGLHPEPADRWPSIEALLDALDPGRRPSRWWRPIGIGALVVGLGASAWWARGAVADDRCRDDASAARVLGDDDVAAIESAFAASDRPYAADASEHAITELRRWDAAWTAARLDACEAGSSADARIACLDDRRQWARATIDRLREADDALVSHTFGLVAELPEVERCATATDALAQLKPDDAARVQAELRRLVQADADLAAGHADDALAAGLLAREHAASLDYPPLVARVDLLVGSARSALGDFETSRADLERAYFAAERADDDEVAFEAAMRLVTIVGNDLALADEGREWARHAEAAWDRMGRPPLARAGLLSNLSRLEFAQANWDEALEQVTVARSLFGQADPDGFRVAKATLNIGAIQDAQGRLDAAIDSYDRAIVLLTASVGAEHPDVAMATNNLGIVRIKRGEGDTGLKLLRQGLALRRKIYGEGHPEVAASEVNLGIALHHLGRYEEALEYLTPAVETFRSIHGDEHPAVASAMFNEGNAMHAFGRDADALVRCQRAVEIWEATLGPEHPTVAIGLAVVGSIHADLGHPDEALAVHQRALDIRRKSLPPNHPELALSLGNLGTVYQKSGRCAEAIPLFEQQDEATIASQGSDSGSRAYPLTARGYCLVELDRADEAIGPLEQALALRPEGDGDPATRAETMFHLGRARWLARDDRERARQLVAQAVDTWAESGPGRREQLDEARAWLEARGGAPTIAAPEAH